MEAIPTLNYKDMFILHIAERNLQERFINSLEHAQC